MAPANLRLGTGTCPLLARSRAQDSSARAGLRRALTAKNYLSSDATIRTSLSVRSIYSGDSSSRSYATATRPRPVRDVAILGGGLTGMTTAYYIAKHLPQAKITIYESTNRLGGWIDTLKSEVRAQDGSPAQALFERGARSFTPPYGSRIDPLVVHELAQDLGLMEDMVTAGPQTELGKRYVFYPDHLCNVSGPPLGLMNPLAAALELYQLALRAISEPLLRTAVWGAVNSFMERTDRDIRPYDEDGIFYDVHGHQQDESLGAFITRETGGPEVTNRALSAIIHGVYGGDVWKLSAASNAFSRPWLLHRISKQSGVKLKNLISIYDMNLLLDMGSKKIATPGNKDIMSFFKGGFGTLTSAIEKSLRKNPNVSFKLRSKVERLSFDKTWQKVKIKAPGIPERTYDKVISTLFSKHLNTLTQNALPSLRNEEAVSIQVVNLYYPTPNLNPPGVGYLIPSDIDWRKHNPEAALGVLFDSARDALAPSDKQAPGTNLTVMLGGHHWGALDPRDPKEWPSDDECIAWAQTLVQRHLHISPDEPVVASTKKCIECIPQHYVGHRERMADAHRDLEAAFGGRLAVAGGSYTNPGVAPSMRAARDVAGQIASEANGHKEEWAYYSTMHVGATGLAKFADSRRLDCMVDAPRWMEKVGPKRTQ